MNAVGRGRYRGRSGKGWVKGLIALLLAGVLAFGCLFGAVMYGSYDHISGNPQIMIILGCQVKPWGPSVLLQDRLDTALDYLEEHPDTSVEQTAADNDVTMKQIRQWVKEERLILSSATVAGIVCEKCGKPIRTGRFCDKCKENMASQLESMYDKPKPGADIKTAEPGGNRMRYLKN